MPHLLNEAINELADKGFGEAKVCVAITHCTAQDTADNITSLSVCGELTIGNRERDSTQVVGDNTHSNIRLLILAILLARECCDASNRRLEHIGIVVRLLALKNHTQALEAHTGIYILCRQGLQRAISLAVELHKYKVPNLDNLRVAHIYHLTARNLCYLLLVAKVVVNLATRTARTSLAHLPEVILLVTTDDVVLGQELLPVVESLLIEGNAILLATLKYGSIHTALVELVYLGEQLPRPLDSLLLEVVAIRPVAEHLEHGVVVGVVAYLLQVVVLTRHTQTLLSIGYTRPLAGCITKEDILELVHTSIGKHQRGVILHDHRCRSYNLVLLRTEKVQKGLSCFV